MFIAEVMHGINISLFLFTVNLREIKMTLMYKLFVGIP